MFEHPNLGCQSETYCKQLMKKIEIEIDKNRNTKSFFFYFKKESLFIRFVQFEKWLVINNKQIIYNFKFLKIGILKTARHWLQNEEANTFTLVENDDGVRSEHAGC